MIRVGFGIDVHRFAEGRDLWIGGIKVPYEKGLDGHSDADVLIHAICDALLGAANLRDIGFQFPDTSDEFLNIDSKILLRHTGELLAEKGYRIGNIDATVAAQAPKLNPYIPAMINNRTGRSILKKRLIVNRNCMEGGIVLPISSKIRANWGTKTVNIRIVTRTVTIRMAQG